MIWRAVLLSIAVALPAMATPWQPSPDRLESDSGAVKVGSASLGLLAVGVDGAPLVLADGLQMAQDGNRADSLRPVIRGDISLMRSQLRMADGTVMLLDSFANHGRQPHQIRLRLIAYLPQDSASPRPNGWISRAGWRLVTGGSGLLVNGWTAGKTAYPGHDAAYIGYDVRFRVRPGQRRAVFAILQPPGVDGLPAPDWLSPAQRQAVIGWPWGGDGARLTGGAPSTLALWQADRAAHGSEALLADSLAHAAWLADRFPGLSPLSQLNPRAFAEARARLTDDRPFAGLPVAVKDIINVAGIPTLSLSGSLPRPAATDAAIVAQLRKLGAVIIGKTVFDEDFNDYGQHRTTGRLRGLYHPDVTITGSSGGSAIAVAAGIVPIAIGSDTCGSLGTPASHAGIATMRPSVGGIPYAGARPLNPDFDTLGPMVADGRDLPDIVAALAGGTPRRIKIADIRLGVLQPWPDDLPAMQPAIDHRFAAAVARLRAAGVNVVPVSLAGWAAARDTLRNATDPYRAAVATGEWLKARGDGLTLGSLLSSGQLLDTEKTDLQAQAAARPNAIQAAQRSAALTQVRASVVDPMAAAGVDALLLPAALAWPGLLDVTRTGAGEPSMCALSALPRLPQATVPLAAAPDEPPLGAALVGLPDEDLDLADIAAALAPLLAGHGKVRPDVPPTR
jgi:Asp-tRNA(Asn)/Glu-tRNA(Gln) amidotransferase A subunit family amidase